MKHIFLQNYFLLIIMCIVITVGAGFVYLKTNVDHQIASLPPATQKKDVVVPSLTIDSIFSSDHSAIKQVPKDQTQVLIATGDIIPARSVNYGVLTKNNPLWPYEKVQHFFIQQNPDITFINLESPLIKNCHPTIEGMLFCGDQRNIEGLSSIGVTVANLANNHIGNYTLQGINQTIALLQNAHIAVTGTNGPTYIKRKDTQFAFLGYNDIGSLEEGISWANEKRIRDEITQAKKQADIIIVAFHWGTEYKNQPDKRQIDLAHLSIESGADLIIGNHPHWIQPVELYKGKLIMYAHGNFIFDQMWSQKTREGVIGKYTFYKGVLIDVEFFPLQIDDYGQAHFLNNPHKQDMLNEMKSQSIILSKHNTN